MNVGLIFGKFAPLTAGHVNFIRMAVESGIDRLYLFLSFDQKFNNTQTPWMQDRLGLTQRLLDLKSLIQDSGLQHKVIVDYVDESNIPGYPEGGKAYAELIRAKIPEGEILTHAFSSEPEYTEYFSEHLPEVEHVVLDSERKGVDISATRIRTNLRDNFEYLSDQARPRFVKRVAIIGVESCVDHLTEYFDGKTWKRMDEYSTGDQVLQYNLDGTASLVIPERYIAQPCNKMYLLANSYQTWEQAYTEDHDIVYVTSKGKLKKTPFKRVKEDIQFKSHGFRGKLLTSFIYSGELTLPENNIRLAVMLSADGSKQKNGTWRVRLLKQRKVLRARELILASGYPLDERIYEDGSHNFYLPSEAGFKLFPDDWYELTKECKEYICEEVLYWDGTKNTSTYFTTEKKNAEFVQYCFSSTGKKTRYSIDNRENKPLTYSVQWCRNTKYLTLDVNSFNETHRKQMVRDYVPTDGMCYCFTVPSGMLVLRRNNHIFITGNCGKSTMTEVLAQHYGTTSTPEVGRHICEQMYKGSEFLMDREAYLKIAMIHRIEEFSNSNQAHVVHISDTTNLVTHFSAICAGKVSYNDGMFMSLAVEEAHNFYDMVLYLSPEVEWVADPLRLQDTDSKREYTNTLLWDMVHDLYCEVPVIHITGNNYENRIKQAIKAIDKLLEEN